MNFMSAENCQNENNLLCVCNCIFTKQLTKRLQCFNRCSIWHGYLLLFFVVVCFLFKFDCYVLRIDYSIDVCSMCTLWCSICLIWSSLWWQETCKIGTILRCYLLRGICCRIFSHRFMYICAFIVSIKEM